MGGEEVEAAHVTPLQDVDVTRDSSRRSRVYFVNALALVVVLLGLIPLVDNGSFTNPDEGLYSAQADALSHGAWERQRPATDVDPDGEWNALRAETIVGDQAIPYGRRPLYPLALTGFWSFAGIGGGMLLSVLGTFVAAVASSRIARQLNPRAELWTLWLVGLGTPLVYDAYLLVAHSIAAALSGVVALAVVHVLGLRSDGNGHDIRPLAAWGAVAIAAAVPLTLIRSEGVLVVFALAAATVLCGCSLRRPFQHDSIGLLIFGIVLAGAGGVTYALNDVWARAITTASQSGDVTQFDRAADPLSVLWSSVIRPWPEDGRLASAPMVLVVLATVISPLVVRWLPRFRLLALGLLAMAAIASIVRLLEYPPSRITGLLPAVPWIVVGILSLKRDDVRDRRAAALGLSTALAFVVIVVTTYGEGGVSEWGGRFFHVLIPLISPLGAIGLLRMAGALPRVERGVVLASVACISVCLGAAAVRENRETRQVTLAIREFMVEVAATSDTDLEVLTQVGGGGPSRMFWPVETHGVELLTTSGVASLPELLDDVPASRERVLVVTDAPGLAIADFTSRTRASDWKITAAEKGPSGLVGAFTLERE